MGCTAQIEDPGSPDARAPGGPPNGADLVGSSPRLARLTQSQYRNTLEDLFGVDVLPTGELPPDNTSEAFTSVGATLVATSAAEAERYHEAALEVADRIWERRDALSWIPTCFPTDPSDACIDSLLQTVGRRVFRRPLSEEERASYRQIVAAAAAAPEVATLGSEALDLGLRMAVAAMLESPSFLYIVPTFEPAGTAWRYRSHAMASRLAYLLTDSTPDEPLLAAADADELVDPTNLDGHIARLLDTTRGRELATRFFEQSWLIHELEGADRDPVLYPGWNREVEQAAVEEFRLVIAAFDRESRDLRDLCTHPTTFLNETLAPIYGLNVSGPEFREVTLDDRRSGLLTSVALLATTANSNRTSPTRRGVFLRTRALCLGVAEPDPEVDTELPEVDETGQPLSTRELVARHRTDPQCAGCHGLFDPLGLTLEHFDAIGAYRETERGFAVDASATFDGIALNGARELGQFLRNEPTVADCMARQFYQLANGRVLAGEEEPLLEAIQGTFASEGYTFRQLVRATLLSEGYRIFPEAPSDG